MKTTRKNKETQVNQGFSQKDQNYLRKFDNAAADPEIQLFTEETLEDENEIQYFCSFCKSKLDHLEEGIDNTIYRCNECMAYYDTNTQDTPLRDISNTRVKAYSEFQYYPTYEDNDPNMIFIQGINLNERNTPGNVEILRDDGFRIKHVRVKGLPAEATSVMNSMDNVPS